MAFISGIFNSTATERLPSGLIRGNKAVDASFFARIFSSFFENGIFLDETGGGFPVSVSPSGDGTTMTLDVGTGACHIRGYFGFETAVTGYTLQPGPSARRLCHVLRLDLDKGSVSSSWKDCEVENERLVTTSGEVLPVRNEKIYDLVTAEARIPAGCTTIDRSMIRDHRQNSDLCGFVAGAVTSFDATQWMRQMDTYLTQLQTLAADLPPDSASYFALNKLNTDLSNLSEKADLKGLRLIAAGHIHKADQIEGGILQRDVRAAVGTDHAAFRLRNIGFSASVPESTVSFGEGNLLGVYE